MIKIKLILVFAALIGTILLEGIVPSNDTTSSSFTKKHLETLRDRTKQLFDHAWDSYVEYGFPADEVRPLSCVPLTKDVSDPFNIVQNDLLGNFSLTVFDNLDTLIIFGEPKLFQKLVAWVGENYKDFDIDSDIQVFETNIRLLGGLLSAHLYASDKRSGFAIEGYDGFLLKLAHDLGERLLLAFNTPSSIPYPRTNLRKGPQGTPKKLQSDTCTSGAGSPVLEFTLLSKLTGDLRFEKASKKLFQTLWKSRSDLDLLPMTVDPNNGKWLDSATGIGASIDSFYEYALKAAILFDDDEYLEVWNTGYRSLNVHSKTDWVYEVISTNSGKLFTTWLDSLSAFWPGLQVLAGDVTNAIKFHALYLKIWKTFEAIPERWDMSPFIPQETKNAFGVLPYEKIVEVVTEAVISLEWYPLRPEFIESTYHLYRATRDPIYLQVGKDLLTKFETKYKAPCGFAGMLDIKTNKRQDRMETFVLGETLKYLYLLFDEDNPIHHQNPGMNTIFSTEAHPMWFDSKLKPEVTGFDWFVGITDEANNSVPQIYTQLNQLPFYDLVIPEFLKNWWSDKQAFDSSSSSEFMLANDAERKKILMESFSEKYKGLMSETELVEVDRILTQLYDSVAEGVEFEIVNLDNEFGLSLDIFSSENIVLSYDFLSSVVNDAVNGELNKSVKEKEYREQVEAELSDLGFSMIWNYGEDTCMIDNLEFSSGVKKTDRFLDSQLLNWPWFYHFDARFELGLMKPLYVSQEESVDLEDDFYKLYTEHLSTPPVCLRYRTSQVFEGSYEPLSEIRNNKVSHLTTKTDETRPVAVYVNDITSTRLKLEMLEEGNVDSFNNVVSSNTALLYRILKLNGYDIPMGQKIVVRGDASDGSEEGLDRAAGMLAPLSIDNLTVVNLFLWLH